MTTWSFSRLKSFETCPKQFYHVTVLGEYPVVQTDAMTYGTAMHKAAEITSERINHSQTSLCTSKELSTSCGH